MKILFIGGTGTISSSCLSAALEMGHDISILCRGTRNERIPKGVKIFTGDAYQLDDSVSQAIEKIDWDCVINWILYEPNQAQLDIKRFSKNTKRYFFISTTSVYDDSNNDGLIIESQKYLETSWFYSKNKMNAEKVFLQAYKDENFPVTIIRPGHTYNDFTIPANIQGFGYGLIKRIEEQKNILVHGDGNSYWTLTHSDDFAKYFIQLLQSSAIEGEIFHIANEEYHTWNEIFSVYSDLIGKKIHKIYMSDSEIYKASPLIGEPIMNDKKYNRIFDLSKLKKYIENFNSDISLHDGLSRVLKWHANHSEQSHLNNMIEAEMLKLNI